MISTTRSPARRPFLAMGPSVHPRSRLNARYFALKSPGDSSNTALAVLLGLGVLSPLGLRDGVAGFAYFDRSGNPAPVPASVASNGPSNGRIMCPTNRRVVRKRAPKTVYEQARTTLRAAHFLPVASTIARTALSHVSAGFSARWARTRASRSRGVLTGLVLRRSSSALSAFSAAAPRLKVVKVSASVIDRRNHLGDAVGRELALDEGDELIGRHAR